MTQPSKDFPLVTIGIPTCGRLDSIAECLASIARHVRCPYEVLVLDSGVSEQAERLYRSNPQVRWIGKNVPIGPGEARRIIAEHVETEYIFFLDDDIVLLDDAISSCLTWLRAHPDIDIVSPVWREYGGYRPVGQNFVFGYDGMSKLVSKFFVEYSMVAQGWESVKVDATQATILSRTDLYQRVQFDPAYDFYCELFDFFMQCRGAGLLVHALPKVVVEHRPRTLRKRARYKDSLIKAEQYFHAKWGVKPVGRVGQVAHGALERIRRIVSYACYRLGL